jgi:hypothetical protein
MYHYNLPHYSYQPLPIVPEPNNTESQNSKTGSYEQESVRKNWMS